MIDLRCYGWVAICAALVCACSASAHAPLKAPPAQAPFGKAPAAIDGRNVLRAASDTQVVAVEAGIAGDRVAALVDVPQTSCAVFIARGTDSIEDLDLLAYGEDGAVLGADEGSDKTPALLLCPPHPQRAYVVARIAAGHGIVAVGVERLDPKDAERAARAYHTRNRPGETAARVSAWPALDDRVAEHRRRIGGSWQDVRRVALPLDARIATRVSAVVEAGRCLNALILPGDDVSHLDVSVLDASGRIAARASGAGRDRALVLCSPLETTVTLEIRPQSGLGMAVLSLSRSVPGTEPDIAAKSLRFDVYPTENLAATREKNSARLAGLGYAGAKVVARGELELGRRASVTLELPHGCARIDVLAGVPVRGLDARLWNADGRLIAAAEDAAQPALFACGKGGAARLDAEALTRAGPFAVEVRNEAETPEVLNDFPLAASRLIEKMVSRGIIKSASQVGKVTQLSLSAERLEKVDFLVPVGRCVDVTLALGEDATGAEIRLVNAEHDDEIALARGTHATSARACTLDARSGGTLHARAELRARAGHGFALTASRMLNPMR